LQHVFCFVLIAGIPAANGHHFTAETLKKPVLASGVSLQAILNQLFFGQCAPVKLSFYINMILPDGKTLSGTINLVEIIKTLKYVEELLADRPALSLAQ
jgi:hypothetical protein